MYGFSIAIFKNCSSNDALKLGAVKNDSNSIFKQLCPGVLICIRGSKKSNYADYCLLDDWIIIGIGRCYSGETFASSIKVRLASKSSGSIGLEGLLDAVQNMPGQYCGVLYNTKTGDLAKVTDPSGSRSLFSGVVRGNEIISSSLSMFRKLVLKEDIQPNIENQLFLLRYAYSIPGQCAYSGVHELPAGRLIFGNAWSKQDNIVEAINCVEKENSNKLCFSSGLNELEDITEKALLKCLKDACVQQVGSAKKVGVLLGGFDSALVASILHYLGVQVETYSFYYDRKKFNQPYTDLLAKALGITHHWVQINSKTIEEGIDKYSKTCSWPSMWLSYIIQTQFVCSRMSEDGMEMCFSGDGCDTAFLGYPSTHKRGKVYQGLPQISKKLAKFLISFIYKFRLEYFFGHLARVGASLIDAATKTVDERPLHSFQIFNPSSYRYLTGKRYKSCRSHIEYFSKTFSDSENLSYERKVYLAKSFISPNRAKLISSSDVSGLPICSPYLHSKVKEFSSRLPDEKLRPEKSVHAKEGKYVLMKMAENSGLLPGEIIYQEKIAAVNSPIDEWLANDLFNVANEKLSNLPFNYNSCYTKNLLKDLPAEKIYKNYFSSDGVTGLAPSLLLTYACFFE